MQPPSPHSRACLQEKVSPIRDTIFVGANTYSPGDSEAGQNITLPISSTEYSQVNAEFICRGSTTAPTGKIMLPDPALEAAHAVADEDPRIPSVRRHLAKPHQPAGSRPLPCFLFGFRDNAQPHRHLPFQHVWRHAVVRSEREPFREHVDGVHQRESVCVGQEVCVAIKDGKSRAPSSSTCWTVSYGSTNCTGGRRESPRDGSPDASGSPPA